MWREIQTARITIALAFAWSMQTAGSREARDIHPTAVVPRAGDHTLLSWRDGPPYITNARPEDVGGAGYSSERRVLRLETGWYSADIDTERIAITGFARRAAPRDEAAAERAALSAERLPRAQLHLAITVGERVFTCTGRRPIGLDGRRQPAIPLEFPVRVIETGRFFQKLALYELEFRDSAGNAFPADAHLEIAAWPDRLSFTLAVQPKSTLPAARSEVWLETSGRLVATGREPFARWDSSREYHSTLIVGADGAAIPSVPPAALSISSVAHDPNGRTALRWDAEEMCHEIALDAPRWPAALGTGYPETMLDALESYDVVVENAAEHTQVVALKFTHHAFGGLTGCVPMLLDQHGQPTGIPVQVSKNWHQGRGAKPPPFAGRWLHGRTLLAVPAGGSVRLQYATTFARWGGVPTASLAQLSLVGWGHNGFWDQLALGSFGESICFQPLRVQRRSLFTDIRPLYQLGMARGERYAWTSNVGAMDTFVREDPSGRYVSFKRNVTRYASHGPNLAELHYAEVSDDDAVQGRLELWLPRTDDLLRVYLRIRYEVRKPFGFSRLAFFQLGSDFYNSCEPSRMAVGHAADDAITEDVPGTRDMTFTPREATGPQPWVSLHGQARDDAARTGQGTRGLIVREWHAQLAGRNVPAPWFVATRGLAPNRPLGADLVPPPTVHTLQPGDYVDMLLELVVLPLVADRYYGPDEGLRQALAAGANTWRPVHREAVRNQPRIVLEDGRTVVGFPLAVEVAAGREVEFELRGGLGWIPVRLTGLGRPDLLALYQTDGDTRHAVRQGPPDRAFWQASHERGHWTVTYNLPAAAERSRYVVVPRSVPNPIRAHPNAPAGAVESRRSR